MSELGRGQGVRIVDLGAFPGAGEGTYVVTGQPDILPTASVRAWVTPVATDDHSADEHRLEPLLAFAGDVVAGVGLTLTVTPTQEGQYGKWSVGFEWANP